MRLRIVTETNGPTRTSTRGRQWSARRPNPSWATEFAIWKHICSVPAAASDKPSCGMSSGKSGA
jgi:hypothetical protein